MVPSCAQTSKAEAGNAGRRSEQHSGGISAINAQQREQQVRALGQPPSSCQRRTPSSLSSDRRGGQGVGIQGELSRRETANYCVSER